MMFYVAVVGVFVVVAEALRRSRAQGKEDVWEVQRLNANLEQQVDEAQALSDDLSNANDALEHALKTTERLSLACDEALADVAHNLRNPLNLVSITTQLLM